MTDEQFERDDLGIAEWWPMLASESREWLTANNGDAVEAWVVEDISRSRGMASDGSGAYFLPDAAVDWIEARANGEMPGL
ncbi:hypothetical protein N2K95_15075 [Arthrobacter zhaoxinii]|uniref:SAM-dependent methyltransferase n=1 Tax=Arthrobacter zhaoxinii TaxID=2964616 RepID=A0ABY5YQ44_9MICC|nr:hypothetical protein [Arthrobacter zhaoxinii]MCQ1999961.1 hypothetical protein [Arthrobacter zhaoxinii]UWX96935.1 hypothetical protein N2K95_15075 [Arthrobacter zhaoxinii]